MHGAIDNQHVHRVADENHLVELGLRAQLVSQSFLTGLLLVQLDFNPEVPPTYMLPPNSPLLEIPTVPTSMQQIQAAARDVIRKLEAINLETKKSVWVARQRATSSTV